jgi:hypothetical protein
MRVLATGIDYSTGRPLIAAMDEETFVSTIVSSLESNADEVTRVKAESTRGATYRKEIERERQADLGDPLEVGWTYLVNQNDPQLEDVIQALGPLAERRGMADPTKPLLFGGEQELQWQDWLDGNYSPLMTENLPYYVLIVGDPELVPFRFQALLDTGAAVGRVAFDNVDDLRAYVDKLVRLESDKEPSASRDIVVFAPDLGEDDPTHFSRQYLAVPLVVRMRERLGFDPTFVGADDATKERLDDVLRTTKPALVYTASHGLGAPNEPLETQLRVNGAICCQDSAVGDEGYFMADDVSFDDPFLEGSVFFQFACFGYGTPAESDYMHWFQEPTLNSERDFVAALPKRLLAHPRGPIAFVGHVDTAWLHGFDDPNNPLTVERFHPRLDPFASAVDELLTVRPLGLALERMNKRYVYGSTLLASVLDQMQRHSLALDDELRARIADIFVYRSDAQNYHVYGDPAARLRIPAKE